MGVGCCKGETRKPTWMESKSQLHQIYRDERAKKKRCKKNNPRSIKYRISLHLPEVGFGKRKNIPTNAFGKSSEKKEESMRPVSPFPLLSLYSHMALIDKACLLKVFSIHSSDVSPPSNSLFWVFYFIFFLFCLLGRLVTALSSGGGCLILLLGSRGIRVGGRLGFRGSPEGLKS